jgi:hypothetical protein
VSEDALEEVARILESEDEQRYGEADLLLDRARADYDLMFRSQRFAYALRQAGAPSKSFGGTPKPVTLSATPRSPTTTAHQTTAASSGTGR